MYAHPWSPPFWWSEELRSRSPLGILNNDDRLFFPYAKRTWSLIAFTFFLGKLLTFVDLLVQRWKNFFFYRWTNKQPDHVKV